MENNEDLKKIDLSTFKPKDTEELLALLQELDKKKQEEGLLNRKLRYVIYVRKSSKDDEHQARSVGDQILECRKLRRELKLKVVKRITERQSAKESGIRPKFTKMIDDIKSGKYDGIISWHPDRLARNMAEAGVIIDMLDKDEIKDLKFCSSSFQNNSSGKMLLGMSFVMSKEYTDNLSDNINRGNKRSVEAGSGMGVPKHGYYRDNNFHYHTDGKYFAMICEAWQMRLKNKSLNEIADYLNKSKYKKTKKRGGKIHHLCIMDDNKLSVLFKDPFYTGVFKSGKNMVNLGKKYHFISAVTVKEYMKINNINDITKSVITKKGHRLGDVKANFLREFVICSECGGVMNPVVTVKHNKKTGEVIKRYANFRCRSVKCRRKKKNVRVYVVYKYILDYLINNPLTSENYYNSYIAGLDKARDSKKKILKSERMSLIQEDVGIKKDILELKKSIVKNNDDDDILKDLKHEYRKKKKQLEANVKQIFRIDKAFKATDQAPISYSEFVELFRKLPNILENEKMESRKSYIIKKLFANCYLKEESVVSLHLNSPFDGLVPSENLVVSGGQELNLPKSVLQTDA